MTIKTKDTESATKTTMDGSTSVPKIPTTFTTDSISDAFNDAKKSVEAAVDSNRSEIESNKASIETAKDSIDNINEDIFYMKKSMNRSTICLLLMLVISVGCMLYIMVKLTANISTLNKKCDDLSASITEQASRTDAALTNMGHNVSDMQNQVNKLDNKVQSNNSDTTNRIKSILDRIDEMKTTYDKEIEDLQSKKKEKEAQILASQSSEATTAMPTAVASAVSYKWTNESGGECSMTEVDDDKVKHNPDPNPVPTGPCLTATGGVFNGPSGLETYYNMDMSVIVQVAHSNGISGEYWIRSDGAKMLGNYIMCACNRSVHPYGTLVQTSLGTGISLDTGGFAANNPTQIDIATNW